MLNSMEDIIDRAGEIPPAGLAVAAAGDKGVLESVLRAAKQKMINPVLVGEEKKIKDLISDLGYRRDLARIEPALNDREAADKSIELVAEGEADLPMKGMLSTDLILKALLKKEYGLRRKKLLSLVTMIELEREEKLIFLSDPGMNVNPDLEDRAKIIKNAAAVASAIGRDNPRVALLAAVENVSENMPSTREAAILSKMADRGQLGSCRVDGPLALDNALLAEAAEQKGIDSEVAGHADVLVVPDIEVGNALYKSMIIYFDLSSASIVYGADIPLVITSRADSVETRFNSIALGKLIMDR